MPILIQDYLDICDPVLTFDRFMGEIDLENGKRKFISAKTAVNALTRKNVKKEQGTVLCVSTRN